MKTHHDIRADVVGSLLRPEALLAVQSAVREGTKTPKDLTHAEDLAVREAVGIQADAHMDVVSDGEMRRPVFCHNFVKAVEGFEWDIPGNSVIWFTMDGKKVVDPVTVGVTGKLRQIHDISVDEFSFLRGVTELPKKITIPSPTMMSYYFAPGISTRAYARPMAFLEDVVAILKRSVTELEAAGVTYIQVDAPEFGMLLDPVQQEWFSRKGFSPKHLIGEGVDMINEILSGFHGTTGLHICRGNDKNRFMAKGGYDALARKVFTGAKVDRLLLEFDSDRAGSFDPLAHVSEDKVVVLGLISTKTPKLETAFQVTRKIREACRFMPVDRLALSTQCGFASVAKGNNLSAKDQLAKLNLVSSVAQTVWG